MKTRYTKGMDIQLVHEKAERVRDVLRYISLFKNTTIVIHISDEIISSPYFSSHIKDIAGLHESGMKVVIVPGAKNKIDSILSYSGLSWKTENNTRITNEDAMPLIKMAAFDVSNQVMTSLAEEHLTAVIGNWVKARGKGVQNGIDFGTAGEIDRINIPALNTILEEGFIPIFPCIGWSSTGKPYNISSTSLAAEIARRLNAEKLFFLTDAIEVSGKTLKMPENISVSDDGIIPALNLEEVEELLSINKASDSPALPLLRLAADACLNGVKRSHIVSGRIDGTLPCEIFSDIGSGTMVYKSNYGGIRPMQKTDVPSVLNIMRPFVEKGILLSRSEEELNRVYQDYIVYELDGGIKACAALHVYKNRQAEIAAVAVDQSCSNIGIGPKMINYLVEKSRSMNLSSVFILTTQTADWFERMGFSPCPVTSIAEERQKVWSPERGSKAYILDL